MLSETHQQGTLEPEIEPFVDPERAAALIGIQRRRLLQMARAGEIPAHPIGGGKRRTWRFRLSELAKAIATRTPYTTEPKKEGLLRLDSRGQRGGLENNDFLVTRRILKKTGSGLI